ncbi:hypothetical protein [Nocardia jinanensis]|uniref:hypothetical protein n=1 Tax=Nocardia jinanensis TaxID=382504 RepID=UPI0012E336DD|nr:hypothetical protein [Nocardia jinanensis]
MDRDALNMEPVRSGEQPAFGFEQHSADATERTLQKHDGMRHQRFALFVHAEQWRPENDSGRAGYCLMETNRITPVESSEQLLPERLRKGGLVSSLSVSPLHRGDIFCVSSVLGCPR